MTMETPPDAELDVPMPPADFGEIPTLDEPVAAGRAGLRSVARWVLGALLVLTLGALLFSLSFAQVTTEGTAKRSLRHSVAILTEVDALLDAQYEGLRQNAMEEDAAEAVELPDFPIAVSLTAGDVQQNDRDEFRALLLDRAADQIYEEGASAFDEDGEASIGFFSTEGAVGNGMDLLRERPNDIVSTATIALAALAGVLALGLALVCRGYGRLVCVGVSVLVAAAPFLILAVAARFTLRTAADGVDEYLASEFLELAQELTWAPIRNGIVFSVGGAALLAMGAALAFRSDRRQAAEAEPE